MNNKVLSKIVYIDSNNNVCLCDKEFFKTCPVRVINSLPCAECLIKVSPLAEENHDYDDIGIFNGPVLFQDTLEHLGRLR